MGQKQPRPEKAKRKPLKPISDKRKAAIASPLGRAGKAHMAAVATLPCVICGSRPVEVHHVICGRYGQRRASDFETIPLCPDHHRIGPDAIHTNKAAWEARHGPDWSYLPIVAEILKAKDPR
jgi:hypothetical protein